MFPEVIVFDTDTLVVNAPVDAPILPTFAFPVTNNTPDVVKLPPVIFPETPKMLPLILFPVIFPELAVRLPMALISVTVFIIDGKSTKRTWDESFIDVNCEPLEPRPMLNVVV